MTNKEINEARQINRMFEQSEKDELFQMLISNYGEALFRIDNLKQEIKKLKGDNRLLLDLVKLSKAGKE